VRDAVLSWHIPGPVEITRGLRLYTDAPRGGGALTATVRSILRANPRLGAVDALRFAAATLRAARRNEIDAGFLAATLLQESAYDPRAFSSAGAQGVGQFTPSTAAVLGIDPWDPFAAIDGSARLLGAYVAAYRTAGNADPYAVALAAYNAGPDAVAAYHGIPPYRETREYIADIIERWSRIVFDR
jgi:soluble lytic murein transglycosylase-like protein